MCIRYMRQPAAAILLAACHHTAALRVSTDMGRRRLLAAAPLLAAPAHADTDDDARLASLAEAYAAGARASGRGANGLRKSFAATGVVRTGSVTDPLFAAGQVLDELKAADGTAVSVSFAFPEAWGLAKGPNLDVRSVQTADSAFVVVAPLPAGVSDVGALPASFFTGALFAKDGKYGSYGGVDEVAVSKDSTENLSTPTGGSQAYRRLALKFSVRLLERERCPPHLSRARLLFPPRATRYWAFAAAPFEPATPCIPAAVLPLAPCREAAPRAQVLTYNQNTVGRRALLSATAVGGSVFLLSSGSTDVRFKQVKEDLAACQQSFRAYGKPRRGGG